ncbi:MAG TPA: hypothetical protein VNO50_10595 [Pyrinomonadaceae bacterium]|nr:hypothetical protein [Pyrinomonadaceae bacterium]
MTPEEPQKKSKKKKRSRKPSKKRSKTKVEKAVKRAAQKKETLELDTRRRDLLRTIADWKLEAKLEDNDRYFFHTSDVDLLENGSRCYVIGRKATGKTAISETDVAD